MKNFADFPLSIGVYPTNIRIPYIYIIRNKETGVKYIGCKFAKDANPNTFWKNYFSSSSVVVKLIEDSSPDIFETIHIQSEEELGESVYDYETRFFEEYGCINSPDWYNISNNMGGLDISSDEAKAVVMATNQRNYQVDNVFESPIIQERSKSTNQRKLGVDYPMQSPLVQEKRAITNQERFGGDSPFSSEEIREKRDNTNEVRHGYPNVFSSPVVQAQIAVTNTAKYGFPNPAQSPVVQAKMKATVKERFNAEHQMHVQSVKDKGMATNKANHNGMHNTQTPAGRIDLSERANKRWANNTNTYTCDHCDIVTVNKTVIINNHNDKCKKNPEYVAPPEKLKKYSCVHCGTMVKTPGALKQFHNDNCKKNPNKATKPQ